MLLSRPVLLWLAIISVACKGVRGDYVAAPLLPATDVRTRVGCHVGQPMCACMNANGTHSMTQLTEQMLL